MNNLILSTLKNIIKVLPFTYRKKSVLVSFLLLTNSVLELFGLAAFIPLFTIILQDNAIQKYESLTWLYELLNFNSEKIFIIAIASLIVLVMVSKNFISLGISYYQSKFSLSLYHYFAIRMHQYYYQKGFTFFKNTNSNIIKRDINDVPQYFAKDMLFSVLNLFNEITVLSLIIIGVLIYDPKAIVLLSIAVLPIFLFFYRWVKKRSIRVAEKSNELAPEIWKYIYQSVFGYVDVQITNAENRIRKQLGELINEQTKLNVKKQLYLLAPTKVIENGMVLTILTITIYGMCFLSSKQDLATLLGVFALAAYRIMPSINRLMIALVAVRSNQYLFPIMMQITNYKAPDKIEHQEITFEKQIELQNISFKFPDAENKLINKFNLTIKKGSAVGIMGPSGSGKTTLMNIMLGFLRPTNGKILIDDKELNESTLVPWRDKIGYVQQDVYIIDGTIIENVAFGYDNANTDVDRVERCLVKASLLPFVNTLPDGINTIIGERGANLSGGQKQRIGIARALYSGASILFFDEATSALDCQTESEITENIRQLNNEKLTVIVIAHRENTLKYCDKIVKI